VQGVGTLALVDAFLNSAEYLHRAACSFGPAWCA
jgi:hypothetical protein